MLPNGEKDRSGPTLVLSNVSRVDGGVYICGAANGVDAPVEAKIDLKVICECMLWEPDFCTKHIF